jgi:hypothetical protein
MLFAAVSEIEMSSFDLRTISGDYIGLHWAKGQTILSPARYLPTSPFQTQHPFFAA